MDKKRVPKVTKRDLDNAVRWAYGYASDVVKEECDKLLKDQNWPGSVTISELRKTILERLDNLGKKINESG